MDFRPEHVEEILWRETAIGEVFLWSSRPFPASCMLPQHMTLAQTPPNLLWHNVSVLHV
jgi:hypothetical protein